MSGAKAPSPEAPRRALPTRRGGYVETIRWKPGFDDPDVEAAGGTEAVLIDAQVTYAEPGALPAEIFLAPSPPHGGSARGLSLQCEDTGTFISLLLRHGWTPQQLLERTKTGSLGRTIALYLARCPRVKWVAMP